MSSELGEMSELANEVIAEHHEIIKSRFSRLVATSTLIMALLTAIGALLASVTANELLIERTAEIIDVTDLDSERLEIEILKTKHALLSKAGASPDDHEIRRISELEKDVIALQHKVSEEKRKVDVILYDHEVFAVCVTLFSIAITLSGMAIIAERKRLWHIGLGIGLIALIVFILGLYTLFI